MRRIATVLAGLLILCGCGGDSSDDRADQTEPTQAVAAATSTAPPSTTTATMSVEEAAARYLELVAPYNALIEEIADAVEQDDVDEARRIAGELATVEREFSLALQTEKWPTDVQPAMDRLVEELASEILLWRQISLAETASEMTGYFEEMYTTEGGGAAELVRQKLGLDSAPIFD